ncbi:MAG: VanZ family protein [Phycisphaerae bacterium]
MALHRQPRQTIRSPWLWIGYWIGLFIATHVPLAGRGLVTVEHGDKLIHFAVYFLLTWLGGRHLLATGRHRAFSTLLIWAAIYALYAAVDEWLQSFVGRTMSLHDWLADLAGIVAASFVLARRPPSATPP